MSNSIQSKAVVILFPWTGLGREIAELFLNSNYQVILITVEKDTVNSFNSLIKKHQYSVRVHHLESPPDQFWSELSSEEKEAILSASVTIHFAGSDYLKVKSQPMKEPWSVKQPDQAKVRFDFVDFLLSEIAEQAEKLWFNLVVGKGAQKDQGIIYCHTRYGMTGFSKVIELNPKFANFQVVNICLTYFKHRKQHDKIHHCSYCMTEKLNDLLVMLEEEGTLGDYLLLKSERYLQKQAV